MLLPDFSVRILLEFFADSGFQLIKAATAGGLYNILDIPPKGRYEKYVKITEGLINLIPG
jgi:hypothetical protein